MTQINWRRGAGGGRRRRRRTSRRRNWTDKSHFHAVLTTIKSKKLENLNSSSVSTSSLPFLSNTRIYGSVARCKCHMRTNSHYQLVVLVQPCLWSERQQQQI